MDHNMQDENETKNRLLDRMKIAIADPNVPVVYDKAKEDLDVDHEYARKKLKGLVKMGEDAIESFKDVAEETGEPRAYEVLATLLKNTGELVKSVMDAAKTKNDIAQSQNKGQEGPKTQNTIIFTGSTKDLLQQIKAEEKTIDMIPIVK